MLRPPFVGALLLAVLLAAAGTRATAAESPAPPGETAEAARAEGDRLVGEGRLEDAEAAYRRALDLDPHDAMAARNLGLVLTKLTNFAEAEVYLLAAVAGGKGDGRVHFTLGYLLHEKGDCARAAVELREAWTLDPWDAAAGIRLGVCLGKTGNRREAIEVLAPLADRPPAGFQVPGYPADSLAAEARYEAGVVLAQAGELDRARGYLESALEIAPLHAAAHYQLGRLLLRQGEKERGQELLARFEDLSKADEEVDLLRRRVRRNPGHPQARVDLGVRLERAGRLDEAEAAYRGALALAADYAPAHHHLGELLYKRRSYVAAAQEFQTLVGLVPEDGHAWWDLGNVALRVNDFQAAERCYLEAIRLAPDVADHHYNLGIVYQVTGRTAESERELARAKELDAKAAAGAAGGGGGESGR